MNLIKKISSCILLCVISLNLSAQYIPGQSYFGANNYIEYIAGDLPIIIVVPHGGDLMPTNLPIIGNHGIDNGTQQTSWQLYDSIVSHTNGCIPHVIINHLHPSVLNAAREIDTAAGTNFDTRHAWYNFHDFIDTAKYTVTNSWGAGHYFEMHGNGHTDMWTEVGLGVSKTYLNGSDSLIMTRVNYSTVKNLCSNGGVNFLDVVKGPMSLGSLLDSKGWNSVPSLTHPSPDTGGFFYAGWNTWKHGSRYSGVIDATHLENYYAFMQTINRAQYANDLSESILQFMQAHYGFTLDCNAVSIKEEKTEKILIKITNVLGQKSNINSSQILFYIYSDGSVVKKILLNQ